jgi:hypothetical protein
MIPFSELGGSSFSSGVLYSGACRRRSEEAREEKGGWDLE